MESIKPKMGDVIRKARESKEMTQATFADAIGATTRTVIDIEKGKRNPTHDVLARIINVLDIPADLIFRPETQSSTVEESQFFNEYLSCSQEQKRVIVAAVRAMLREWNK